jgi:PAN domain
MSTEHIIMFSCGLILIVFGMGLMVFKSTNGGITKIKLPVVELEVNGGALFVMLLGAGLMYFAESTDLTKSTGPVTAEQKAADQKAAEAETAKRAAEQKAAEAENAKRAAQQEAASAAQARAAADQRAKEAEIALREAEQKATTEARASANQKTIALEEAQKAADKRAAEAEAAEQRAAEAEAAKKTAEQKAEAAINARVAAEKKAAEVVNANTRMRNSTAGNSANQAQISLEHRAIYDPEAILRQYTSKNNRDIPGEDIVVNGQIGLTAQTLAECAYICDRLDKCKGFTFDHWNNKCYPKNNIVTSLLDPHSTIALKSGYALPKASKAEPQIKIRRNHVFNGTPIANVYVDDFAECQNICQKDLKCVAFSFLKSKQSVQNCKMYSEAQGGYSPNNSADIGWKQQFE